MAWSNLETFKFLDLYQNEPAIWDTRSKDYKDRKTVKEAWLRLEDAMQIPMEDLKKRKETLMTAFRLHYKKKQTAITSGLGEDGYRLSWIYYDKMEGFLKDIYELKSVNDPKYNASTSFSQIKDDHYEELEEIEEEEPIIDTKFQPKTSKQRRPASNPLEYAEDSNNTEREFKIYNRALKEDHSYNTLDDDEECELYGRLMAKKLRRLTQIEREEFMYEVDGLLLNRLRKRNNSSSNVYADSSQAQIIISKLPECNSYTSRSSSPT